ncbi:uncharacterized protein LOC131850601 [Achroia grisella]|uniref:uncharacterized protein LOC131850601 n=1 Tax=Achroia grisella TaxID=688607 RepID=UPI0027D2B29E|nr:uncharacterized protein LOC131850601 [Achroia grisella]
MKNTSLKDKFKNNIKFVKPLYRKVKTNRVGTGNVTFSNLDVDNKFKLCGDAIRVKRDILNDRNKNYDILTITNKDNTTLPGACEYNSTVLNRTRIVKLKGLKANNKTVRHEVEDVMINKTASKLDNEIHNESIDKFVQANEDLKTVIVNKAPDTWLRVYPAPQYPKEPVISVIFRCLICQLGIATFLVFWTILWVFVINSFEESHEIEVSRQFEKQQNQLVIDLATELRQITPLSPKWKNAIEIRIEDERRLTMQAVDRGAKLHPGQFWNLSGTFLFTVYVMTALGFGAPVPQTLWGRSSALVYAVLAVPTHIYLMVNASTCVVHNVDQFIRRSRRFDRKKTVNSEDTSNCGGNSGIIRCSNKTMCYKITSLLNVLFAGRCVPLAAILYYTSGAVAFGLMRGKTGPEVALFPLEFTTSGGLEQVKSHVRILYGLYVEGAMSLLACALATLRRNSSEATNSIAEHYRLFATTEK